MLNSTSLICLLLLFQVMLSTNFFRPKNHVIFKKKTVEEIEKEKAKQAEEAERLAKLRKRKKN